MDENYLDSLLNGVSSDNEANKSFDNEVNMDAGVDIDFKDLDNISLEELDELDNLDFGDLTDFDLDGIDFDDLDITKMTPDETGNKESVDEDDFNLDDLLKEEEQLHSEDNRFEESQIDNTSPIPSEKFEDSFDFSMLDGEDSGGNIDIDDLFSALGIEDDEEVSSDVHTSNDNSMTEAFDSLFADADNIDFGSDFDDIPDIEQVNSAAAKKKKKGEKKNFSEILFGEPDEDDLEEEALFEKKKAQKKEQKEKKKEVNEAKKAEKKEALEQKKQANKVKEQLKLKKKKEKEAVLKAELEAEKNEKKVSNVTVAIVFIIFIALALVVFIGTKEFDYNKVIKKAKDYFERDRYSLAYDEVAGVEVKEKDQELKDRIYTVMYVERLYESYENNMSMGRPDKALDALLRGLEKYDVHYEEAVELDIVEDIDLCKSKIILALSDTFGLSEEMAKEIIELEGQEYLEALLLYSDGVVIGD